MAVKEQMMRRFSERVAEATPGGQNATPFGELVIHGHSLVENHN